MTTDADVIVAGAGPAGSMAAWELASRGHQVLVLEKSGFPRYKVCGAGLTAKILREIPFDVSPVLETEIHTILFSSNFQRVYARTSAEPVLFCTDRGRFDEFLLGKAVAAGARVIHGAHVRQVNKQSDRVEVVTNDRIFHSKLVVGADGASGVTARFAGLRNNIVLGIAWEAEVAPGEGRTDAWKQTVFLDWGAFPGGYGWAFPKGDHLSIGVGGPGPLSKHMMDYFHGFLEYLDLRESQVLSLKSWPIPVKRCRDAFSDGRILVAGDAAGLTDPLTGEGIYYAVRSGRMAGEACDAFLAGRSPGTEPYSERINRELMGELLEAERIRAVFNTVPLRIHSFVRDSERGWRAFGKILRGERGYADVPAGFGRWRLLWGTACLISGRVSAAREQWFRTHGFTHSGWKRQY